MPLEIHSLTIFIHQKIFSHEIFQEGFCVAVVVVVVFVSVCLFLRKWKRLLCERVSERVSECVGVTVQLY